MTKLLAIEGTDIRLEIGGYGVDMCERCPLWDSDWFCCAITEGDYETCPLPEKTDREVPDDVRVFGGILRRMYSVVHHCEGTHGPPPTVIELGCGCILARKKYVVWSADEKKG